MTTNSLWKLLLGLLAACILIRATEGTVRLFERLLNP